MSDDREQLIHRIYEEIINQRRLDVVDELFDPDYLEHGPQGDMPGRETFKANLTVWLDAFSDLRCEVSNVVIDGDVAGWLVRTTGTHTGDSLGFPATGKKIDTLSPNLGRLRDGRAVEHWSEQGMLAMLTQLGIIPAMAPPSTVG